MRSDQQTDIFRDSASANASQWREAEQAAREQFPTNTKRHEYYAAQRQQAERLERQEQAA